VSFFDESPRLAALSRLNDPLVELAKRIDFEMFRPVLTQKEASFLTPRCKSGKQSPCVSDFNYFGSKKFPKRVLADLCNVKKTDGWLFGRI
jgi:hypothetical protein